MKKLLFAVLLILCVTQCSCAKNTIVTSNVTNKVYAQNNLNIMVTNKTLYYMVCDITGQNNYVDYMFKDESKLEKFSYSSDSTTNISKQDLFFYSGADFETWVDDFVNKVDKNKVGMINVSRGITLSNYENKLYKKYDNQNPYYWLDYDNYKVMLVNIKNAIEEKDPENRTTYETNFNNSIKKIDSYKKSIDTENDKLKQCTFVQEVDDLDYFVKETSASSIKFYRDASGNISSDDENKISKEKENGNKLCFIYNNDQDLQVNQSLIAKYGMTPIKLTTYDGNLSYFQIIQNNEVSLQNAIK